MIKLNNKNITYVALADSSNSLKAPKEIWYADSSNSVKLVYRRKDALIEDEDYEKYHWLKGDIPDNKRCIDLPINSNEMSYSMLIQKAGNNTFFETIGNYRYYTTYGTIPSIKVWNIATSSDVGTFNVGLQTNKLFNITSNESSLTINGIGVQKFGFPISAVVLRSGATLGNAITETSSIFVNGVERYIPCKLLKPVPKWLDANGIRRQVGECGMIDLVSGKFYGNVNSVGTFTVENYYERKEWLVADIPVGVNMMTLNLNEATTVSFQRFYSQSGNTYLFRSSSYLYTIKDNINNLRCWDLNTSSVVFEQQVSTDGSYDLILSDEEYIINNISIPKYGTLTGIQFYNNTNALSAAIYKNSKITVDNKEHYIPCTLTMDLPASMDANNIARTKGTSGMWDLVSDRFYGNVANSGTFKAVNLAEGVDYEVHQWIVKTGGSYISIPINLWKNRFDMCIEAVENYSYFSTRSKTNSNGRCMIAYNSGDGSPYILIAFREGGSSHITELRLGQALSSNTISIFQKDGIATGIINGVEYQDAELIESSWNYDIECQVPLGKTQYFKVYNEDGTYRSNLIPIKLLRSIPAKYDANGIARNAGECGMYDTVNDVFYGNVASSGTFSVSDDN